MHAILTSFGSTGDLLPLLSVGRGLAARGNRVTVAAGEGFRAWVEEAGLDFFPVCSAEEYERSIREVGVLASRYRGIFFRKFVVGWNAALLRFLAEEGRDEAVYVSAERPTLWADLCAHAHFHVPCVRLAVDLPASARQGLGLGARGSGQGARGMGGGALQEELAEEWQQEWRRSARSAGVNAGHRHTERLNRATMASVPRLALWPDWFAPAAARNLPRVGFVGAPAATPRNSGPKLPTPNSKLVFIAGSLGTTGPWERQFAATSREICDQLGCEGILLGGTPAPEFKSGPRFTWEKYVPLDAALDSAAAIVHHGGIGTTAAAMKAAVPQLIIPRMFGQTSNATCARKLGVGAVMAPEEYSVAAGKAAIGELLAKGEYRMRSQACAERIDYSRDAGRVCDFVQDWYARSGNATLQHANS